MEHYKQVSLFVEARLGIVQKSSKFHPAVCLFSSASEESFMLSRSRKTIRTIRRLLCILSLLILVYIQSAEAGGLSTTFGEVVIENLKIGQTYSVRQLANIPLTVLNTGDRLVELKMDILRPQESELKKGYEPIPDTSWVSLEQSFFTVEPKGKAETDVFISIPDDERYLGGKYHVWIWSHTVGGMIGLGLKSRLLFTISPGEAEPAEKERDREVGGNLNFDVEPKEIYLHNIEIGKIYNVEKETGITLNVINPNDQEYIYKVRSIRVADSLLELKEGYEDCPESSFLGFSKTEFTVPARGGEKVQMFVSFPNDRTYAGRKYMFVIHTTQGGVGSYSRVYTSLSPAEQSIDTEDVSVKPRVLLIQEVPLGELYSMSESSGIHLSIHNKRGELHTYILSACGPSSVGLEWPIGYSQIPDPDWLQLGREEMSIDAGGVGYTDVRLRIPMQERYYNQKWVVAVAVKSKPGQPNIAPVYLQVQIETQSRGDTRERATGLIGLEPGAILLKNVSLGFSEGATQVRIYNNDEEEHTYTLIPMDQRFRSAEQQIISSPTYSWIPEPEWIIPAQTKVEAKAGGSLIVPLNLAIPEESNYYGRKWEGILFVRSDEGFGNFLRIQIETEKAVETYEPEGDL